MGLGFCSTLAAAVAWGAWSLGVVPFSAGLERASSYASVLYTLDAFCW